MAPEDGTDGYILYGADLASQHYAGEYLDLALNLGPYQNRIIGIGAMTSAKKPSKADAHCVPSFSYI